MALARMMMVELYLALFIYSTIKRLNPIPVIFLISLAISHYGTAYLLMFSLFVLIPFSILGKQERWVGRVSNTIIALFSVVTLFWYQYIAQGFEFRKLVHISKQTLLMLEDVFNPQYSQGLYLMVSSQRSVLREITKWVNISAQAFITLGVIMMIYMILKKKKSRHIEFYILSFIFFFYDVAGVMLPLFANRLNVSRLYHLTHFFIAPYLLFGFSIIKEITSRFKKVGGNLLNTSKIVGIFLIVYFLFTSGWILTVADDPFSPVWLKRQDYATWTVPEIAGGKWIAGNKYDDLKIFSDQYRALIFLAVVGQSIGKVSFKGDTKISNLPEREAYIYFGEISTKEKKVLLLSPRHSFKSKSYMDFYSDQLQRMQIENPKIYVNGDVMIYLWTIK